MPKEKLPKITVKYNGLFDFDGMYAAIIDWSKNYGFMWHEGDYKHKVPSPKGAEQEFKWVLEKKVTDYISYEILITVHMWELLEVDVDVNGKKKSLSNGRLYIWIEPTMFWDWQKRFAKSGKFGNFLGRWYDKIMQRDIDAYMDPLYYRVWNLQALMKKYFDMQSKKYAYKGYLGEN